VFQVSGLCLRAEVDLVKSGRLGRDAVVVAPLDRPVRFQSNRGARSLIWLQANVGFQFQMTDDFDGPEEAAAFARAVASAQSAVAGLTEQYIGWVSADLARLQAAQARIQGADDGPGMRHAFEIAHVIKGQGGTFGYPLVTAVAGLLCRYLERAQREGRYDPGVAAAHLEALTGLVEGRIAGEAGDLGGDLVATLQSRADRSFEPFE